MQIKTKKRKRRLKIYLLSLVSVSVIVAIIFFLLIKKEPNADINFTAKPNDTNEVSPYITHQLLPDFYNQVQKKQSFRLLIEQDGINDAVSRLPMPQKIDGARIQGVYVLFKPEKIKLYFNIEYKGLNLIVTATFLAHIDEKGLMYIGIEKVKLGAVSITPIALNLAERIYQPKLKASKAMKDADIGAKIANSIFNGAGFEPVFKVEDKWIRLESIDIQNKKIFVGIEPVR